MNNNQVFQEMVYGYSIRIGENANNKAKHQLFQLQLIKSLF